MPTGPALAALLFAFLLPPQDGSAGRDQASAGEESPLRAAEAATARLYDLVSFGPGTAPDWRKVRAAFLEQAVVVLRTSPAESTLFDLDGFVADFTAFAARPDVRERGFEERVVKIRSTGLGDIAHVLVLYEASVPGSPRPPQQGVDSFQLIRQNGKWRIVSVINEIPAIGRPLPPELRD